MLGVENVSFLFRLVLLEVTLDCTPTIMTDDQNVHSKGSEPASSQSAPCCTCQMCKKAICAKSLAITIACIDCGGSCHVGCLVNNFVDTHGGALKTSLIWLTEFLRTGNFRFTCDSCSKLSKDASLATQSALVLNNRINAEFATLKQCIAAIDSKISSFLPCVNQRNSTHSAEESDVSKPSAAINQGKPKVSSKTYAAAVGSDLPAIVKSVVAESFKAQRHSERDNASLVIYKLKETNNNLNRIKELFSICDCADYVIRVFRLSKSAKSDISKTMPTPRPLKVELWSQHDRDYILQQARFICRSNSVRISKYLSSTDMAALKEARSECAKLNSTAIKCTNGRDRFVIINERIMKRLDDGKLVRVAKDLPASATTRAATHSSPSAPSPASLSSTSTSSASSLTASSTLSTSKNDAGGSLVAPSKSS